MKEKDGIDWFWMTIIFLCFIMVWGFGVTCGIAYGTPSEYEKNTLKIEAQKFHEIKHYDHYMKYIWTVIPTPEADAYITDGASKIRFPITYTPTPDPDSLYDNLKKNRELMHGNHTVDCKSVFCLTTTPTPIPKFTWIDFPEIPEDFIHTKKCKDRWSNFQIGSFPKPKDGYCITIGVTGFVYQCEDDCEKKGEKQ